LLADGDVGVAALGAASLRNLLLGASTPDSG